MADRGDLLAKVLTEKIGRVLTISHKLVKTKRHMISPPYLGPVPLGTNIDLTKEIRGTVVEVDDAGNETVVPGATVKLFYRQSDVLVDRVATNAIGEFVFPGLYALGMFYAVAVYPSGSNTAPNSKIFDRLMPQTP